MTEKEIRALIERRREDWRYGNSVEAKYKTEECKDILELMDEQEEPVSIWHDSNEEQPEKYRTVVIWNPTTMDGEVLTRCAEVYKGRIWAYIDDILNLSNVERTVKNWKEPVSEELIGATNNYCVNARKGYPRVMDETDRYICNSFKAGAQWQKENLWKPADGEDLPECDREVIVLTQPYSNDGHLRVAFAHRPNKYTKIWNSDLGEGQVVEIERYGKGEWNIPNIVYWLDTKSPYEENKISK